VLLSFLVLLLLIYFLLVPFTWLWYILVALFCVAYLFAALLYCPLYYFGAHYSVDRDRISFESGVFGRHSRVMFRNRIITVILIRTPLDRLFGLSNLRCNGAGATLMLWNLPAETAKALQTELTVHVPASEQRCES
jgi:membrane protein YdbS with pleckstrin-like domain